jgi:anti-anti-sigma factor
MQVKIDTKEKFTLVLPLESHIYDNMAEELAAICHRYLETKEKNLLLNFRTVTTIDKSTANIITKVQQVFYEKNASFVICELSPAVKDTFKQSDLLDSLNYAPTESEAGDIIQMEEIERELSDN